jgi:hypothetical protein
MRGAVSFLLMAVFGFSLIAPAALPSDTESNLPACCQHGGKHHCALMASRAASSAGPSLRAAPCALFPAAKASPATRTVSAPAISQAVFAALMGHPASRPQTEALCRISYSRAGQKRAPPTPLS